MPFLWRERVCLGSGAGFVPVDKRRFLWSRLQSQTRWLASGQRGSDSVMLRPSRPVESASATREIKVKIPIEYHLRLHTLKVLRGQSISTTVERALSEHFARLAGGLHHLDASDPALTEVSVSE